MQDFHSLLSAKLHAREAAEILVLHTAEELRLQHKYDEALKVLEQVQHHKVQQKFVLYNAIVAEQTKREADEAEQAAKKLKEKEEEQAKL